MLYLFKKLMDKYNIRIILNIIFSLITRIILCTILLFSDPLSLQFKFLCIIIFCIPWIRFFMNDTDRKNIDLYLSYKLLFLTSPILYFCIIWKISELYQFTLINPLILFLLTLAAAFFIKAKSKNISTKTQQILMTMSFYCIPFFLAINISFDFSQPSSKEYFITDKESYVSEKMDSEGSQKMANYEFKVIPKEKMNPTPFWIDISATKHPHLHPEAEVLTPGKVFLTIENKKYEILTNKIDLFKHMKDSGYLRTYQLREYTKPMIINVKPKIYNKFGKNDYLDIEIHSGLFGIEWTYYHWKHKSDIT